MTPKARFACWAPDYGQSQKWQAGSSHGQTLMTRKAPAVVWVVINTSGCVSGCADRKLDAGCIAWEDDTILRYRLDAPKPRKPKAAKRRRKS